jgi:hypothetical protein
MVKILNVKNEATITKLNTALRNLNVQGILMSHCRRDKNKENIPLNWLRILTVERGLGRLACRESVNDEGCFPVGACCLRFVAFIRLKSVTGNTPGGILDSGVDCDDHCVGVPGDARLFLLSGRDGGMPRPSSDGGDKLSCVSHSNLVNRNIIVSLSDPETVLQYSGVKPYVSEVYDSSGLVLFFFILSLFCLPSTSYAIKNIIIIHFTCMYPFIIDIIL